MNGIEVIEFQSEGYQPLVNYGGWRVAVLRFCDDLRPEAIVTMQKHDLTDEVFVLLQGQCILYEAGKSGQPEEITAVLLESGKLYNVKKGVWHNHTMSENGIVLIVENQNTTDINSPRKVLNEKQRQKVCKFHQRWIEREG